MNYIYLVHIRYLTRSLRSLEDKFHISARPCIILYVFETEIQPTSFQHFHKDEKVHRPSVQFRLVVYWRRPANESPLQNSLEVGFCTLVSFFWKNTPENVELSEFVFSLHLLIIFILYASMWSHYMFSLFCQKEPQLIEPLSGNYSEDEEEHN